MDKSNFNILTSLALFLFVTVAFSCSLLDLVAQYHSFEMVKM